MSTKPYARLKYAEWALNQEISLVHILMDKQIFVVLEEINDVLRQYERLHTF